MIYVVSFFILIFSQYDTIVHQSLYLLYTKNSKIKTNFTFYTYIGLLILKSFIKDIECVELA